MKSAFRNILFLLSLALVLTIGGNVRAQSPDGDDRKKDESFVDLDGDGIHDGKEKRFRKNTRDRDAAERRAQRRKHGTDGGGTDNGRRN